MPKAKTQASVYLSPAKKAWATRKANAENPKPAKPRPKMEPHAPIKLPKDVRFVSAAEIMVRTTVLGLTFSGIGNRRKISNEQIEVTEGKQRVEVDKGWISATKQLLDAEELTKITSLYGELRRHVEARALPSHIKKGVYLLPVSFSEDVNTRLKTGQTELEPLVESIVNRLGSLKKESKQRLQELYDEDDYPTAAELRAAFRIHWRFWNVDSAKNLEAVSREVYEEERKKAEQDWSELRETIRALLRTQLSELVDHMVDRLKPDADGRPKTFKESSLGKIQDFLSTFEARNITDDAQMQVVVERVRGLVIKADADMLRTDETVRDYVRQGFETIKSTLDPMVVSIKKKHRNIRIEQE